MEQVAIIKVAMICLLSNSDIRSHLKLDYKGRGRLIKLLFGEKVGKVKYADLAPWNTAIVNDFKHRDDIDLTIISTHNGMLNQITRYFDDGVHYIFLNHNITGLINRIIKNRRIRNILNPFARIIKREIGRINPDLLVLVGAESQIFSSTVLSISKYPVYVLCQTVYNNPARKLYGSYNAEAMKSEMQVFMKHRYFGVYCKMHYDLVHQYSPGAFIFKFGFPSSGKLLDPFMTNKEYDFVNFAVMMVDKKGFPDTIKALAIVKKKYPKVKLNLTGICSKQKKIELEELINELGLIDNVFFTPFFEKQSDLFLHVQKSRFAVLPCKLDNTAGTMSQAMQLGLPLVVYKTTGTPLFNKEKECVLIAEHCNIEDLASKMLELMDNPEKAEMLRKNAREFQQIKVEDAKLNGERLVNNFKAIIANYRYNTNIPLVQLFNPKTDN